MQLKQVSIFKYLRVTFDEIEWMDIEFREIIAKYLRNIEMLYQLIKQRGMDSGGGKGDNINNRVMSNTAIRVRMLGAE